MQRRRRRQKGNAMVETALTFLVFFTLLLGLVDIGQMLFLHQSLVERVRNAVRWGSVNNYDPTSMQNLVLYGTTSPEQNAAPFWGLSASNVTVTNPNCGSNPNIDCHIKIVVSGYNYTMFSAVMAWFKTAGSGTLHGATIEGSLPSEQPNSLQ